MVFVASVDGLSSAAWHAGYGAAKAGLLSLVRTAAMELRDAEIRVNAVAPGSVATPRMLQMRGMTDPDELATGSLQAPARTWDIASAILFLSSPLAAHITGQTLAVDGGALAQSPFGYLEPPVAPGGEMGSMPSASSS
jgi:3-oxoacyl-[acyl-carrier protein] reductase